MTDADRAFCNELNNSSNIYGMVSDIAKRARSVADKCGNRILHSEAITKVVSNDTTDIISDDSIIDEYEAKYIKEMFAYIDDKSVKDAVYDSFYESKAHHNLIFIYNDIVDEGIKARVRVITRMLWYKLIN